LPSNSGRQKQIGKPFIRRQPEFGPHGFGSQLSPSGTEIKYVVISNKETYNSYIIVHLVDICTFQVDKLYCSQYIKMFVSGSCKIIPYFTAVSEMWFYLQDQK
jgi:hypothetical protein